MSGVDSLAWEILGNELALTHQSVGCRPRGSQKLVDLDRDDWVQEQLICMVGCRRVCGGY